jgi:hypothetical protein
MSTTARHFDAIYRYQEGVTIKSVGAPAVGPGLAEDGRGQRRRPEREVEGVDDGAGLRGQDLLEGDRTWP